MDDESYDPEKADVLSLAKLKVFRDLSLLVLGVFTAMSFKWHRLSQCLYYLAFMLFMSEALIISPEKREWIYSPTTKVVAAQLLMADKVLPQSICLTIFWAV